MSVMGSCFCTRRSVLSTVASASDANCDIFSEETPSSGEKKLYPPMTTEEIEDWMEHIPVFAVTDSNGAGVVLKPDNNTSVFYFFLNPLAANATLAQLKGANSDMDLKVSAFSLGKIWFKLLNADPDSEVTVSLMKDQCFCQDFSTLFLTKL